ncbi:12-oxophytodienoate reductase 1 [Coccomyxa sp. Obi]|nr:12-oxophytodienoate reductase 1 [Coccomyxa sp. Obi]
MVKEDQSDTNPLLTPWKAGRFELAHRVVLAPLTRCRALGTVPQPAAIEYYSQRATKGGLMITEATCIAPEGHGYPETPGIYTQEQINAWKPIVEAVHAKGAKFILQLWHVGRASHSDYQPNGQLPVSSSPIPPSGKIYTPQGLKDYEVPRALEESEIPKVVEQYRQGARNALEAGFDGVEVHGANGYLIDQFLKSSVNHRKDKYGGPIENRVRFALEITRAVVDEVGADRVGIRLSPFGGFLDAEDEHPYALNTYLLEELNKLGIAYVHFIEPRAIHSMGVASPHAEFNFQRIDQNLDVFRRAFHGAFIAAGGHSRASGIAAINANHCDAIAYGRPYLANPDLVKRFEIDAPLNKYDRNTFYTQDQKVGYTDYPFLSEVQAGKAA